MILRGVPTKYTMFQSRMLCTSFLSKAGNHSSSSLAIATKHIRLSLTIKNDDSGHCTHPFGAAKITPTEIKSERCDPLFQDDAVRREGSTEIETMERTALLQQA